MPTNTLHRASPCQDFGMHRLEETKKKQSKKKKGKKKKSPFATCFKKFHNALKTYNEVACFVSADKQLLDGRQGSSLLSMAIFCQETNQQY